MAVRARTIERARSGAGLLSELTWVLGAPGAVRTLLIGHRRPRAPEPQVLAFSLVPLGASDVLARAEAMPPVPAQDALGGTLRAVRTVERMGVEARPVPALEAAAEAVAAARRSGEVGIGLDCEGCVALATLLRALGEPDAGQLPLRLVALPPWDVDEGPGQEHESLQLDELVGDLIAWCERRGCSEAELGAAACVADAMGRYRLERGAPMLHGWSAGELEDFLLGWLPGALTLAAEHVALVAPAAAAVLRFLGESERLPAHTADGLAARALELAPAYARASAT